MKFLDYIKGSRHGKNAHTIEYNSLTDPFLADAIDGYDLLSNNQTNAVLQLQTTVWARTASSNRDSNIWKITAAAITFVAIMGGYSLLINHKSSMMLAHETENSYINLYVPDSYVEQKGLELAQLKEANPSQDTKMATAVDIVNLDEVIKPLEKIDIYVPSTYYAQSGKGETKDNSIISTSSKELVAELQPVMTASLTNENIANETLLAQRDVVATPSIENQIAPMAELSETVSISPNNLGSSSHNASMLAMGKKKKEVLPQPVSGYDLYNTYIRENKAQIYDPSCKTTTGVVILSFNVNDKGRPTNIVVEQGLCNPCNDEAIRLLNEGGDWTQSPNRGQLKVRFNEE